MKPRELILNALYGKSVSRTPAGSILSAVTYEMMDKTGVFWPDAHKNAEMMVKLASCAAVMCGWDSIKLPFDMMVEVEALGGGIDYGGKGTLPQAAGHMLEWGEKFCPPGDYLQRGRISEILRAVSLAKKNYGDTYAVVVSLVGPFALAGKLYGTEDVLTGTILEPEFLSGALDRVTDCIVSYANALSTAGADIILMGDPTSSGDLISGAAYEKFVMPCHARVAKEVKAPVVVHICGCVDSHLPFIAKTGLSGLSFDFSTSHEKAAQYLNGVMAKIGWVDPLGVMWKGASKDVYEASCGCIKNGADILTPGCALSPATPLENMRAMARASLEYKK